MRKLILRNFQSPGDVVMLTAAVRDLHLSYPGEFVTDVRTACDALWAHNPHLTPLSDTDGDVTQIDCEYPLIHHSNQRPYHFIHGFIDDLSRKLGVNIQPTAFKGDIHLAREEKRWMSQVHEITREAVPFWIIVAGGKTDFTIKWWDSGRWQQVVDHFRGRILFVQVGEAGHIHPPLDGVLDLRGRTNLRQLVRLVYHAQGVVCPVTALMHLAAAVEVKGGRPKNRPCVVVAGGREPAQWEAYPHHQYIHTNGALMCCDNGGCWRSRTVPLGDGDEKDEKLCMNVVDLETGQSQAGIDWGQQVNGHSKRLLPRCMDMITAEEVIRRIESYFHGGTARYLTASEEEIAAQAIAKHAEHRETINRAAPPINGMHRQPKFAVRLCQTVRDCTNYGRQIKRLFVKKPKVGLVVGTYGSTPYVQLHLEARRRIYPEIPILVHDDCSPRSSELESLCTEYGAEFATTIAKLTHSKGDLSAMAAGLVWARDHSLDILVKMSRRFIPLKPWDSDLADLAMTSQYATFSSWTSSYDYGFRTECLGFAVDEWFTLGLFDEIIAGICEPETPFVEGLIHRLARQASVRNSQLARAFDDAIGQRPRERDGYAIWPFMGTDRCEPNDNFLWHDSATPEDYAAQAREWGLSYQASDYRNPDMGC